MVKLGTEAATTAAEPLWRLEDLGDLQRQWEANEARRRRLLHYAGVGVALLLASGERFERVFALP